MRHAWWDRAPTLVRALSRERDAQLLAQCGAALAKAGQYGAAKEALLKLGDSKGLADLAVAAGRWEDAGLLAVAHPELAPRVHVPHGAWLAARDRWALSGLRLLPRDCGCCGHQLTQSLTGLDCPLSRHTPHSGLTRRAQRTAAAAALTWRGGCSRAWQRARRGSGGSRTRGTPTTAWQWTRCRWAPL